MKRIFTLALYSLWLISAYGQISSETAHALATGNGSYLFEKAELFVRNAETKEVVEYKVISDTASIEPYEFHQENIFLEAELSGGYLIKLILADRQEYIIDNMILKLAKEDKTAFESEGRIEPENRDTHDGHSLPSYHFELEGEKLIVAFNAYPFGHSDFNFTLEAELTITMTKQK